MYIKWITICNWLMTTWTVWKWPPLYILYNLYTLIYINKVVTISLPQYICTVCSHQHLRTVCSHQHLRTVYLPKFLCTVCFIIHFTVVNLNNFLLVCLHQHLCTVRLHQHLRAVLFALISLYSLSASTPLYYSF